MNSLQTEIFWMQEMVLIHAASVEAYLVPAAPFPISSLTWSCLMDRYGSGCESSRVDEISLERRNSPLNYRTTWLGSERITTREWTHQWQCLRTFHHRLRCLLVSLPSMDRRSGPIGSITAVGVWSSSCAIFELSARERSSWLPPSHSLVCCNWLYRQWDG